MANRPYAASGKSESGALVVLVAASLGVALASGLFEGFVSQWLNVLLVFPAALGLVIGGAGIKLIASRRVRNPIAVAIIGLVTGFVAQACVHAVAYELARSRVADALEKDPRAAAFVRENGIDKAVDTALTSGGGSSPLAAYIHDAADAGITITHGGGSSSNSPTLTGTAVYVLWLAEFLVAGGLAAAMLFERAKEPFCETCTAWYNIEKCMAAGAGDKTSVKNTIKRLKDGALAEVMPHLGESDGKSLLMMMLRSCSGCRAHEPVLEIRCVTGIGKKRQTKKAFSTLLDPKEVAALFPVKVEAPTS